MWGRNTASPITLQGKRPAAPLSSGGERPRRRGHLRGRPVAVRFPRPNVVKAMESCVWLQSAPPGRARRSAAAAASREPRRGAEKRGARDADAQLSSPATLLPFCKKAFPQQCRFYLSFTS